MVAPAHGEWERPAGPTKPFLPSQPDQFDERNPPPHEDIPDHAAAKQLNRQLHPMRDGLPGDLAPDREPHRAMMKAVMEPPACAGAGSDPDIPEFLQRKLQSVEPSYVDLVGGGMIPES